MSEPAFPGVAGQSGYGNATSQIDANGNTAYVEHNQGMSMLDYFAGQALVGFAAARMDFEQVPGWAFTMAEKMMAEREKRCAARSAKS